MQRVHDTLGLQRLLEGGLQRFVARQTAQEVADLGDLQFVEAQAVALSAPA